MSPSDQGLCLLRDGKICNTLYGEGTISSVSLESCLKTGGVTLQEIDLLAVSDRSSVQWQRILRTGFSMGPEGATLFVKEMLPWIGHKRWMEKCFGGKSDFQGETLFVGRHESLAAAAFFQSGFKDAAIVTMDRGLERSVCACGTGASNQITMRAEQDYPHSLELFYLAFLPVIGLKSEETNRLAELAASGKPKYSDQIFTELLDLKEDGSFRLDMNYFTHINGLSLCMPNFRKAFGWYAGAVGTIGTKERDLACSLSVVMEEVVLRMLRCLNRIGSSKNLCITNSRSFNFLDSASLAKLSGFDKLHVQDIHSSANGAALNAWHQHIKQSNKTN